MPPPRRVVTGTNEQGRSLVLFDGPPTAVLGPMAEIWFTETSPATNVGSAEATDRPFRMEPPAHGSVFRFLELEPDSGTSGEDDEALRREMFAALDAEHAIVEGPPGMHRTNTTDYVVVLAGRVTMILDEESVDLEPFDVVVQRGTSHTWVNRGSEPAYLLAAMVDAEPVTGV